MRFLEKLLGRFARGKRTPALVKKTRLWLETFDERILPDATVGDPPTYQPPVNSSLTYLEYLDLVTAAESTYSANFVMAESELLSRVSQANSDGHFNANEAYQQYRYSAESAYTIYQNGVLQAVEDYENSIENANATLIASLNLVVSDLDAGYATLVGSADAYYEIALSGFNTAVSSADNTLAEAINSALLTEDYSNLISVADAWEVASENAAGSYDTAVASIDSLSEQMAEVIDSQALSAITAATAAWESTIEAAAGTFDIAEASAWSNFLYQEADAWAIYQNALNALAVQQQSAIEYAIAQFGTNLQTASSQFESTESAAWASYVQGLPAGEQAEVRTSDHPVIGAPAVALSQISDSGPRLLDDPQFARTTVTLTSPNTDEPMRVTGVSGSILVGRYQMIYNRAVHSAKILNRLTARVEALKDLSAILRIAIVNTNNEITQQVLSAIELMVDNEVERDESLIYDQRDKITADVVHMSWILQELIRIQHPGLLAKIPGYPWMFNSYLDPAFWYNL